jgi:benzoate-CoA ligase
MGHPTSSFLDADVFFSVPTFYAPLLRADVPRDAFRPVRVAVSADERLPPEVHGAWRERFGVLDGLGTTETVFMVLSNRPGVSRAGSAGTPVPGADVRLLDDRSRDVPEMRRDAEGFYHHAGREDDLFRVAGQWVAPGEVEAVMLGHPRVAGAGVVGAEDAARG